MKYFLDKFFIKQPKLRRFVTRLLEGNRDVDVRMLGGIFRLNSIKEHGYLRASRLISKSSLLEDELPILLDLASLLSDGDTFVDVGANIGIYSLSLARLRPLHKNVNYYAFEANPDTFQRLKFGGDKLGVQTFNLAVTDHVGVLDFIGGAVSHVFTSLDNANEYSINSEIVSVTCSRLDEINLSGNSIIIKIDVEGQELKVLEGARSLFRDNRVKAVYLDGYKDRKVETYLKEFEFTLRDGRTLEAISGDVFSLLALKER